MAPNSAQTRPAGVLALLAGLGLWAALFWLALRLPPDGREHGDLAQFVGRFHPLLVHGPVALLALVPLLELAGLSAARPHLRAAAGWVLAVAAAAAFCAAFDGWLLAWSGGYRGRDVTRHMWGGVWLAGACLAAARARAAGGRGVPLAYPVLLALAVGLMVWTGHGGGAISHGDGFLTDKMPARMRAWLGLAAPAQAPAGPAPAPLSAGPAARGGPGSVEPSDPAYYRLHIAPLFDRSCASCHRPGKHKGGLRLDSYGQLMLGGDDGAVVVPGKPRASDILRRLRLAPSDDDSMPSDGDKPLTPQEIQMIEEWIAAGARNG